jgi:hypothetical protein
MPGSAEHWVKAKEIMGGVGLARGEGGGGLLDAERKYGTILTK